MIVLGSIFSESREIVLTKCRTAIERGTHQVLCSIETSIEIYIQHQ
jgi:hypothetical protein